jgi:adhesin/invasin
MEEICMHRKRTTADTSTQAARPVRHSDKPSRRYHGIRPVAVLAAAAASLLTVGVFAGSISAGAATSKATSHAVSTGGSLVGVTPARLADTRAGSGFQDAGDTPGAGGTINVQVTGKGGVPASGVSAVVLNVTAVDPTALTFVDAYPQGGTVPATANLVVAKGQIVSNLVTVPVGTQGGVTLSNHAGSTDLVVDVDGYYTTTPQATGNYDAVAPVRVLGSTTTTGFALGAGATEPVTVTGSATGIPADATAVVANLTASNGSGEGFLTAFPAGATLPTAANLVYGQGQVIGNRITIPIGTNGAIDIFSNVAVNVDLDVDGYYTGSATEPGSTFTALSTPARFTDTRTPLNGTPMAAGATETFSFASDGIPSDATALASNVSVEAGSSPGFLTIFPTTETTPPVVADLNWPGSGSIVQNFADAPLNGDAVNFYNQAGGSTINLQIDAFGYFVPISGVTVLASPTSIPANGSSTSTITTTVENAGSPIGSDPVQFILTPSTAGSCGALTALSPAGSATNASGQITATYTSTTVPGSCTIQATEADNGLSGSTTVTQTGVNSVVVTPTSPTVEAGTAQTFTATVDAVHAGGTAVTGDTVTWSTSGGASCGTFNPTSGTTAGGTTSSSYTASATAGFCTITATESQFGDSGTDQVDQTSSPAVTGLAVTLTATPSTISANGTSTSALTGTVLQTAAPIAGDQVALTGVGTPAAACGTITPAVATTSATGAFTATYTSSTTGGTCAITATEADSGATGGATVTQQAVENVAIVANPATVPANGLATSAVTATVTSPTGAPVASDVVTFTPNAPAAGCGSFPTLDTATTNASGQATLTYTAGSTVGFCTVTATATATVSLASGNASTTIRQGSASGATASSVTVSASPASIAASGSATPSKESVVTVTVDSTGGVPVDGDPVALAVTPAATCGSVTPATFTTNAAGQSTTPIEYQTSTTPGTCTVTATEANSGLSGSAAITQTGFNTVSFSTAPTTPVPANGSNTQTIGVTVTNSASTPVAGDTVTFSVPAGCGTFTPTSGTTSSLGVVDTSYKTSTTPGFCTVTATESGFGDSASSVIDQESSPAIATATPAISAATASVPANGTSTDAITGTVTQAGAVPVANDQVLFTVSPAACGTVSPAIVTSSAAGTFSATYTSSTTVEAVCAVTATEADTGTASAPADIAQTTVHTVTVDASPSSLVAGSGTTSTITITVTNTNGTPVVGDILTVAPSGASCGTVTGSPVTTNASGVATATYNVGATPGFCTITATETNQSPPAAAEESGSTQITQNA